MSPCQMILVKVSHIWNYTPQGNLHLSILLKGWMSSKLCLFSLTLITFWNCLIWIIGRRIGCPWVFLSYMNLPFFPSLKKIQLQLKSWRSIEFRGYLVLNLDRFWSYYFKLETPGIKSTAPRVISFIDPKTTDLGNTYTNTVTSFLGGRGLILMLLMYFVQIIQTLLWSSSEYSIFIMIQMQ